MPNAPDEDTVDARLATYRAQHAEQRDALRAEYPGGYCDFATPPPPTARLSFETLTRANAPHILALFADDPNPYVDERYSDSQALTGYLDFLLDEMPWSRKHAGCDYLVRFGESGQYVGLLNIYDLSQENWLDYPHRCTIGYQLAAAARGRGLGGEAVAALLAHARDHFARPRVLAYTEGANAASVALLRGLGFVDETAVYDEDGTGSEVYYTKHLAMLRHQLPTDEYADFYGGYVGRVPTSQTIDEALAGSLTALTAYFEGVDPAHGHHRYAPGKWSVGEALQHVIDTERIFAYRALRAARADATPLAGFDQDAYVAAEPRYRYELPELLAEIATVRTGTRALFASIREEDLPNRCHVAGAEVSARAWGFITAGHAYHHAAVFAERYGG